MMAGYGYIALSGPQGIPALRKKWTEIRQLEEDVANLQRDNQAKKEHIRRLETDPAEQEMEIRKRLKLLRPGETSFILPEGAKVQ
jgi:cell division protein FtsB